MESAGGEAVIGVKFTVDGPYAPNFEALIEELFVAADFAADDVSRMEEGIVQNWETSTPIVRYQRKAPNRIEYIVRPVGAGAALWYQISRGVPGKTFGPKKQKFLRFKAASIPGSSPGGRWGGKYSKNPPWVTLKSVNWPGIRARLFEEEIVKKYKTTWAVKMAAALDKGTKRAQREVQRAV